MIITDIIPIDKKRDKVYIDSEFAFVLYKGELRLYNICANEEINEATYRKIVDEVLVKRAKMRAMNLLMKKDYTEKGMRRKLEEGYYMPKQIEETLVFLKNYGYIDDERYARNYFAVHIQSKTRNKIVQKLIEKGISYDLLNEITDSVYEEEMSLTEVPNEWELGQRLLIKKRYDLQNSINDRKKAYGYLLRNGISNDMAMKLIKEYEKDDGTT